MNKYLAYVLAAFFVALPSVALAGSVSKPDTGTGFEGRVVCDSQVFQGARVYVYKSFGDMLADRPVAVSAPTKEDGSWKMDCPSGTYYLAAKKLANVPPSGAPAAGDSAGVLKYDGPLAVGDYFCFQGSNPITAVPGKYTHVGFALVKYTASVSYSDSSDKDDGTLTGVVTWSGQPVKGAIVTLYMDGKDNFRGQGYSASPPTGKDGVFRMEFLPDTDYFLIARKRQNGKKAGPLEEGDDFGYYVANPVHVKAGKIAKVDFGVISKAGEIGREDSLFRDTGTRVTGRILDDKGKPVDGVYAFAYVEKVMAHKRPEFISKPADKNGTYVLNISKGGTYYIGARSRYGGTPSFGEWYGCYEGTGDHHVNIKTGQVLKGIDIPVEKIPQ